jgi:hypothetical protein
MSHSLRRHGRDTNIRSGLPPAGITPANDPPESRSTGQILYRRLHEQPRVTWSRTVLERHCTPVIFRLTPQAAAKAVPRLRHHSCRLPLSVGMHPHPIRPRSFLQKRQKPKLLSGLTIEIQPPKVKPQPRFQTDSGMRRRRDGGMEGRSTEAAFQLADPSVSLSLPLSLCRLCRFRHLSNCRPRVYHPLQPARRTNGL